LGLNINGMDNEEKQGIMDASWKIHAQVESAYLQSSIKKGDIDWLEKQRFLLADMALHLLQTAIKPGELEEEKLKNNLHAILTITDEFLPQAELKKALSKIYL
jgi:hypothetical protein